MTITRAQIPEQIDVFENGGAVPGTTTSSSIDPTSINVDPQTILDLYGALETKPITTADVQAQAAEMSGLFTQPRKANFFDLASEIGAGLVAGASAPGGFGGGLTAGLQSFNEMAQKRKAEADKIKQEVAMLAYKQVQAKRQEQLAVASDVLERQFELALEGSAGPDFGSSERGKALSFIVQAQNNPDLKTVPDPENPGKMMPNPQYVVALLIAQSERIVQTETGQIRVPGIDVEGAFENKNVAGPKTKDGVLYTPVPGETDKNGNQIYMDPEGNKGVLQ